MKKKILASVIALLLPLVLLNWSTASAAARKIERDMVLMVHVIPLYAEQPDQNLAMPVKGIKKDEVDDTWHGARPGGRLHEGQDIFAPFGTAVFSATDGYVMSIGENNLGGQTVSVIGAGGRIYYYAHLAAYAPNIEVGDHLTNQTVLGFVGTSGNAADTPPHLHFGMYARGNAINPLPLLTDRPDEKMAAPETDLGMKKR